MKKKKLCNFVSLLLWTRATRAGQLLGCLLKVITIKQSSGLVKASLTFTSSQDCLLRRSAAQSFCVSLKGVWREIVNAKKKKSWYWGRDQVERPVARWKRMCTVTEDNRLLPCSVPHTWVSNQWPPSTSCATDTITKLPWCETLSCGGCWPVGVIPAYSLHLKAQRWTSVSSGCFRRSVIWLLSY